MLRLRSDISLGPADAVVRRAGRERWLDGVDDNYYMGWGKGEEGRLEARERLATVAENGLLGIYKARSPVGWVVIEGDGEKSVALDFYVEPQSRVFGVAHTALRMVLDDLFDRGIYRVGCEPLAANHAARDFLNKIGFQSEGRRWARCWMQGKPHDTSPFCMTAPRWAKIKRRETDVRVPGKSHSP